jgi:hypothetical protein
MQAPPAWPVVSCESPRTARWVKPNPVVNLRPASRPSHSPMLLAELSRRSSVLRLGRWCTYTSRRGWRERLLCHRLNVPLNHGGRVGHVLLLVRQGGLTVHTISSPCMVKGQRSRLVEGGEAEVKEDDKDEYRAPTWRARCRVSKLVH